MLWRVVIRLVACMTVLLSLGVMVVSAYAAKTAPPRVAVPQAEAVDAVAATPVGAVSGEVSGAASTLETAFPDLSRLRSVTTEPTPAALVAAPDDAGSSSPSGSARGNLSVGTKTWPVVSLPPGTADPTLLSRQSLEVPLDQLGVMLQVAQETNVPWQVFAGIAKIESDFGQNMSTSSAGAIGYGQFLPSVWELFGEGGDPYDFRDVIPAMGRYLLVAGAPDDIPGSLYAYNHSWSYVAQVLSVAATLGYSGQDGIGTGAREGLIWPVVGPISSYFGPSHPLGIDIDQTMAPGTPVLAAHSGTVLFAGGDPCCSYGYYVILASPTGLTTLYAHFSSIAVEAGDTVSQGQPLGIVGNTGYSTGTHLHFEVIDGGYRQDPLLYLP